MANTQRPEALEAYRGAQTEMNRDERQTLMGPWRFVGASEKGLDPQDSILQRMILITAVAIDREGRKADRPVEEVLGCGFIMGSVIERKTKQKFRIVCTAAHLLSEAEKHLRPDALNRYNSPFASGPLSILGKDIWRIHGYHVTDDRSQLASQAVSASVFTRADLACLLMTTPPKTEATAKERLMLIESDPLRPGSLVTMIGAPHAQLTAEEDEGGRTRVRIRPGWEARAGTITAVLLKSRLTGTPVYETSIPAPGAMSGGPVLLTRMNEGQPQIENVAIGVLSHDLPAEENRPNDTSLRGYSYVVPAMLIYGLLVPPYLSKGVERPLGQTKIFRDVGARSSAIQVQLKPEFAIRRVRSKDGAGGGT